MKVNLSTNETKRLVKLGTYNVSVFILGSALVQAAYGNYKYAKHLHGFQYNFSVASSALIGAIGIFALGKWLINKEVEVK